MMDFYDLNGYYDSYELPPLFAPLLDDFHEPASGILSNGEFDLSMFDEPA